MQSLFERVRDNKRRTWFVFFLFYLLFFGFGIILGYFWGDYILGVSVMLISASFYFLIMWNSGDSIILSSSKAKEVTSKSQPELWDVVDSMRISAGIPMPKVYVIEDSALNAFATGRDPKHASIVVTSGLLEKMNRRELEGVIAHEMSHVKNYDIRVMLFAAVLVGAITLVADIVLRSFLWGGKSGDKDNGAGAVLIIFALILAILAPIFAQLIRLVISRRREYLADADAVVLTRYPKGLANALRKIANDPDPLVDTANKATAHLYISVPFRHAKKEGWWTRIFSTHPPIEDRIKILESL